ncbi:MAG: hypothetical protein KF709_04775 [Gemmatimonadaceae bacterium]|nr:hypothetical protein [Gemmatimonadaceae bacterium]
MSRTITAVATAAVVFLASCTGDSPAGPPRSQPLPPLAAATWYVHAAEGQPLPALIAHRLVDGTLEQDFLDSATVEVRADSTWERRMWFQRYRAGATPVRVAQLEWGRWAVSDSGYLFTSDLGVRSFVVARMTPGDSTVLPIRGSAEGYVLATLRSVAPPPTMFGEYRVATVNGHPLPSAMYVFPDVEVDGRRFSTHYLVDSARLALHPNGQYQQGIYYSEWEGEPNGPPTTLLYRAYTGDFGTWTRSGTQLAFESGYLQNHRFSGNSEGPTGLALLHGLSHGDPPVPVTYAR